MGIGCLCMRTQKKSLTNKHYSECRYSVGVSVKIRKKITCYLRGYTGAVHWIRAWVDKFNISPHITKIKSLIDISPFQTS